MTVVNGLRCINISKHLMVELSFLLLTVALDFKVAIGEKSDMAHTRTYPSEEAVAISVFSSLIAMSVITF